MDNFIKGTNRKNTNCIKWDVYKDLLPFWIADSDYETGSFIKDALIKRIEHGVFGYTYIDEEYYEVLIDFFKNNYHYEVNKDDIIPTHGIIFTLYLLLKLFLKENDSVVISTPIYNPFYDVITNNGLNVVCNSLIEKDDSYVFDFDDLENKLKNSKAYLLCNPHNPIGKAYTHEEVSRIVELCKKYDCLLIADEIHCDLVLSDYKFNSFGLFLDKYDKLIVATAPSKTFNIAGLQIANIIIKNPLYREKFKSELTKLALSVPNLLSLVACFNAYKYGLDYIKKQKEYIYSNYIYLKEFFNKHIKKAKVFKLEATYLVWVNLSYLNLTDQELNNLLLENKILINLGSKYDKNYKSYIRINIATTKKNLDSLLDKLKNCIGGN